MGLFSKVKRIHFSSGKYQGKEHAPSYESGTQIELKSWKTPYNTPPKTATSKPHPTELLSITPAFVFPLCYPHGSPQTTKIFSRLTIGHQSPSKTNHKTNRTAWSQNGTPRSQNNRVTMIFLHLIAAITKNRVSMLCCTTVYLPEALTVTRENPPTKP